MQPGQKARVDRCRTATAPRHGAGTSALAALHRSTNAEGKRRSRSNARKTDEHDAEQRARLAWVWVFQQFFSLFSGACVAVCGDPRGPRADATMGKLEARLRQVSHLLPADLDTDTATARLGEHRRLGSLPPPEDDLLLFLLAYA